MISLKDFKIAFVNLQTTSNSFFCVPPIKKPSGDIPLPIGLGYVASYLNNKLERINIRIIDGFFENPLKSILQFKPHLIGISVATEEYSSAMNLARKIRQFSSTPLIIGGYHISLAPEYLKEPFDVAVLGEGEETMLDLVRLFIQENSFPQDTLRKIPGLAYKKDGRLILTERRKLIEDLDSIPYPHWELFNKRYLEFPNAFRRKKFNNEATIITSRGCYYRCIFCAISSMSHRIRFRTAENAVEEISYLYRRFGIDFVVICDATFTCNRRRLESIIDGLKQRRLLGKIRFLCQGVASTITEDICKILKEIGVDNIFFGFESGSNRILQYLKKSRVSVEDNKRAFRLCKRFGIKVSGSFIFGSPNEALEDMKKTAELIKWMFKNGMLKAIIHIAYPYPGTPWWQEAKRRGYIRGEESDIGFLNLASKGFPLFLDQKLFLGFRKVISGIMKN